MGEVGQPFTIPAMENAPQPPSEGRGSGSGRKRTPTRLSPSTVRSQVLGALVRWVLVQCPGLEDGIQLMERTRCYIDTLTFKDCRGWNAQELEMEVRKALGEMEMKVHPSANKSEGKRVKNYFAAIRSNVRKGVRLYLEQIPLAERIVVAESFRVTYNVAGSVETGAESMSFSRKLLPMINGWLRQDFHHGGSPDSHDIADEGPGSTGTGTPGSGSIAPVTVKEKMETFLSEVAPIGGKMDRLVFFLQELIRSVTARGGILHPSLQSLRKRSETFSGGAFGRLDAVAVVRGAAILSPAGENITLLDPESDTLPVSETDHSPGAMGWADAPDSAESSGLGIVSDHSYRAAADEYDDDTVPPSPQRRQFPGRRPATNGRPAKRPRTAARRSGALRRDSASPSP